MFPTFQTGQVLRHLDLNVTGVVESEVPITIHRANLPQRSMVNVRVDEFDNIWWDITRVVPEIAERISPTSLTVLAEPVTT